MLLRRLSEFRSLVAACASLGIIGCSSLDLSRSDHEKRAAPAAAVVPGALANSAAPDTLSLPSSGSATIRLVEHAQAGPELKAPHNSAPSVPSPFPTGPAPVTLTSDAWGHVPPPPIEQLPAVPPATLTLNDAGGPRILEFDPSSPGDGLPIGAAPEAHLSPPWGSLEIPAPTGSIEPETEALPIDFPTVLMLAAGRNPQVAFAHERIREAFAELHAAEVLWLPSINAGFNYNKHEGRIQDVVGDIIETSRGSFFGGMGSRVVGAGSPAVPGLAASFHLRDAIFAPAIAERTAAARRQAATATTNDTLLEVALAYLALLESHQQQAITAETLRNAQALAELTADFAETGLGTEADADRARAELAIRQNEARRAGENVQVASTRLARLLSQDPTVRLDPQELSIAPIDLVPLEVPVRELVATGLTHRPELAENRALVSEAVERLRREKYAPLIPSVFLGVSYGSLGGGLGGDLINWGDRFDFDVAAWWEVRNLGFGERAARDSARSRVEQARFRQVHVMDRVAQEVTEAHTQVQARKEQIATAQSGIEAAADSYRRNLERIHDVQGLPIEVLQSIQALDQARREYVQTVIAYNEAQFRLHRALGWPIQH